MDSISAVSTRQALGLRAGMRSRDSQFASRSPNSLSLSIGRHGGSVRHLRVATESEKIVVKINCLAVRSRAVESKSASTTTTSFDELKKGDLYFATDTRPVVLFDGVCNMCNGGVNFLLDNDSEGKLRFAALQSEAGKALLVKSGRAPDDISSVVLVDKDRAYIKSEAVIQIAQYLDFPLSTVSFLGILLPMFLRDMLYDTVADNRYSTFGRTDACRLSDPKFGARFIE